MAERQERKIGKNPEPPVPPEDDRRTRVERRYDERPVEVERRVVERRSGERLHWIIGRIGQGVDYLFFLLYSLMALRLVLTFLGASEQAGFVRFIRSLTEPFYAPFSGIVSSPSLNGNEVDLPALIALLAYVLLHIAVRRLLRLISGPRVVA